MPSVTDSELLALRDIAERVLTTYQYQIWLKHAQGWTVKEIALDLHCRKLKVSQMLRYAQETIAEALQGFDTESVRFGHTLQQGRETWFAEDRTAGEAARRLRHTDLSKTGQN